MFSEPTDTRGSTAQMLRAVLLSETSVLYTKEPFQTADGKMAESRMGDEEACLDLKLEKMI